MSTVEFYGETFQLRAYVSDYALGKFAQAAAEGGDASTMEGWRRMMDLTERCITVEDWPRFDRVADENEASFDDLTEVIKVAVRQSTDRPTGRLSDSSDGPPLTEPKSGQSAGGSDLTLLLPGRPDKQLAVARQRLAVAS